MRRILIGAAVLLAVGAFLVLTLGASGGSGAPTYKIELDNAFGLVSGEDFKVNGVIAGTIQSISLDQKTLHAVVTVQVTNRGYGQFHTDVFCQSRPQSLIGEYFLDCEPGNAGPVLKPGSTIPVNDTQSTIPADLVQNIMQLPYRQRFTLIVNELGAAVASRSEDLASALRRADPALAETDNLLNLLGNDAQTINQLNVGADQVITALANNNKQMQKFVVAADNAATDSATQAPAIQKTWEKLPAFLAQLRPALAKLGAAADAQDPVFQNLNAASSNLKTFFHDLTPFDHESVPALQSLGQASAVGTPAVKDAEPAVQDLNNFANPTPELAQNLSIVLQALDTRTRSKYGGGAVEADPRSPDGGKGYTGLESLLQYVYNIALAINYYGPYGHLLGVDAFANSACSQYATPSSIAQNLASYSAGTSSVDPRSCYSFLGPDQPGVTTTDPSDPTACVPDPGGYPVQGYGTRYYGAATTAKKCAVASSLPAAKPKSGGKSGKSPLPGAGSATSTLSQTIQKILQSVTGGAGSVTQTLKGIVSGVTSGVTSGMTSGLTGGGSGSSSSSSSSGSATSQTQQLLNYLLSP